MIRRLLSGVLVLFGVALADSPSPTGVPLPNAHSHNDYLRPRPLLDALDQGFCGVEADVFLVDGDLLVAHNRGDVTTNLTFRGGYLEPIARKVREHSGIFARPDTRLLLLVDVKEDGEKVYEVLRKQLAPHAAILTRYGPSGVVTGAVTVVISGDRAVDRIAGDTERLCAVDGRLEQLTDGSSASLYPLMSDSWPFRWRGKGAMPADEVTRLRGIVAKAHEQGRRVRFWGGPDELSAWKVQKEAGVDIINTDHLRELGAFLRGEPEPRKKVVEDSQ